MNYPGGRYFDVGLIKRHSQETTSTNQDDPDEEEGVEDQDDEHWYLQIARFWWCNRTYYKGLSKGRVPIIKMEI